MAAGHATQACRHLVRARWAFAGLGDTYNEARVLRGLGRLYVHAGRADLAFRRLEPALDVIRAVGSRFEEARTLEAFGDAKRLAGDEQAATRYYEQALALYQDLDVPQQHSLRLRPDRGGAAGEQRPVGLVGRVRAAGTADRACSE
jgi:tetratricopeptide (TPR) repeat protein